jgi:hypothetical protein
MVLDRAYSSTALKYGLSANKRSGGDNPEFPIAKARLRALPYSILLAITLVTAYGWSLHSKTVSRLSLANHDSPSPSPLPLEYQKQPPPTLSIPQHTTQVTNNSTLSQHMSVPLILQFFLGASIQSGLTTLNTLLTDLNMTNPATAQASCNLVRCAMAALGTGILQFVIDSVGVGWCFTILTFVLSTTVPGLCLLWGRSVRWRLKRKGMERVGLVI